MILSEGVVMTPSVLSAFVREMTKVADEAIIQNHPDQQPAQERGMLRRSAVAGGAALFWCRGIRFSVQSAHGVELAARGLDDAEPARRRHGRGEAAAGDGRETIQKWIRRSQASATRRARLKAVVLENTV